ncbi:hypothetical protein [Paraburkholderia sp. C35]|uniref:hypothetical protein n=1 Tax=Paraburkholderia sp. C35 TaxID=2126993 RepID=UPI000D68A5C6|nr:hypothetical protein [Paraburkholderia sp. C35]
MFFHRLSRRPSSQTGRLAALAVAALLCVAPAAIDRPAHAATANSEIQVSLTIYDICTMNTDAAQPQVACSAGAPFRVYKDDYFAQQDAQTPAVFAASSYGSSVEIAF